ncbi:MAG: hypothetical protein IT303_13410 [Dehalococcoidia bacterium]|nr:hypothetical protein [Dehalococcoidia bacterium]
MRGVWVAVVLFGAILLAACDDSGGGSGVTPTAPRRPASTGTSTIRSGLPTPTPGVPGRATVTIDGVVTTLVVPQCVLSNDGSTILITGEQTSPRASLTVVSVAGSTTITFNRDDVQWGVAAAAIKVDGNNATYSGPARRSSGAAADVTMTLEVRCGAA